MKRKTVIGILALCVFSTVNCGDKNSKPAKLQVETLKTKKLIVVDGDGRPRATIGTTSDGQPYFRLTDEKGIFRVEIHTQSNGEVELTFYDKNGDKRAGTYVRKDGKVISYLFGDAKMGADILLASKKTAKNPAASIHLHVSALLGARIQLEGGKLNATIATSPHGGRIKLSNKLLKWSMGIVSLVLNPAFVVEKYGKTRIVPLR